MMNGIIPLLGAVALIGVKKTENVNSCLEKQQTSAINGLFVIMVFIRHFYQYVTPSNNDILFRINVILNQLIIVSFMFFSGYAFVKQYSKSGGYLNKLPRKIISLWLVFILTVSLFIFVGIAFGNKYDAQTVLLSFIGMRSVGNSTWYVVAILFMWIFSYIAFKQKFVSPLIIMPILTFLYIAIMSRIKDAVFYNTVIAYLFGIYFAFYERQLISLLSKYYYLILTLICILLAVCSRLVSSFLIFELWVILFSIFLILFSIKIQINNKVLNWLSAYTLEIYLIQRIPMTVLEGRITANIVYFAVCLILTLGLAIIWKKLFLAITKIVSIIMPYEGKVIKE